MAQRKLALELEIHRAIVAECTFQDSLQDKVQAVQDVLKIVPDSCSLLAEMLPDLREAIDLSEGDTIIMVRRLNTRLDWNLGDSELLRLFGLQTQAQEYPE